jgi:hypothetical protein
MSLYVKKGYHPWNKGLTKKTDIRLEKLSETSKKPNISRRKYNFSLIGTIAGKCLKCEKPLIFKYHHFWLGIPKYCHGHNPEPIESIEKKKREYKGRVLRLPWTDEQRKAFSGTGNPMHGKKGNFVNAVKKCKWLRENDPEWKDKWLKKVLDGSHIRPNYPEKFLTEIIQHIKPGEFKYTGAGDVIIGGKNPDWFNVNGKKQVIEFFGRRWHKPEDEHKKIDHYKVYGYSCLVIWAEELKDLSSLEKKIKEF